MPDVFKIAQSEEYQGDDWWKWAVWVEAPDEALDRIDYVEWILHATFPDPVRRTRDRESKFRLETGGWGVFQIAARVMKKDGEQIKLRHDLSLHYPDGEVAPA